MEGRPVLVDSRGPFGNPTADSARTTITLECTSALVVVYAPASSTEVLLREVLAGTGDLLMRYGGGSSAPSAI